MSDTQKYDLFISYRRQGGVDYARMLYLELKGRGYSVFFDYNSLRDGKFNEGIFNAIDACRYFLLVVSTDALERCSDEDDWVRHEIERALAKGKTIIPICPSGCVRSLPEHLPESLAPLRLIQISLMQTDDLFEKSLDKIVEDRFDAAFRERHGHRPSGSSNPKLMRRINIIVVVLLIIIAVLTGYLVASHRPKHRPHGGPRGEVRHRYEGPRRPALPPPAATNAAPERVRPEPNRRHREPRTP